MRLWIKLAIAGVVLLGAVLLMFHQVASQLLSSSLTREMRGHGEQLMVPMVAALVTPLLQQDYATVQQIADEVSSASHFKAMVITDPAGRTIASAGRAAAVAGPPGVPFLDAQDQLCMLFASPLRVAGQDLGELRVVLSAQVLADGQALLRRQWLIAALVTMLLFALVVIAVSRWWMRPLNRLTAAAQRLAMGDYEVAIEQDRRDELGLLSRSFAAMRDTVQRRMTELAQARDAAESANRAKSAFLANTSHELRTPLNVLVGLTRLLNESELPAAKRAEYLRQLDVHANTLATLISDVLDLSKIEAGQLTIDIEGFDLRRLVRDTCRAYRILATERGIELSLQVDDRVPERVAGDAGRLRQVLVNYLGNALKFTAQGRIDVTLEPAGGERVRLSVRDSGVGIDSQTLLQLFEPFVQADASTARQYGGTGLGLSICRQLATLMSGEVGAESTPGAGSRFWIELPMPAVAEPSPQAAESAAAAEREALRGARVLLVDDNPVNLLIGVALLEAAGVVVTQAVDGRAAIDAVLAAHANGQAIDVVLMDLQMPVMNGHEATRELRRRFDAQELPIVALTAAALTTEREQTRHAGMNDFLTKPIDADRLRRIVGHWVMQRRMAPAA